MNVQLILDLFAEAKHHLKYPKVRFTAGNHPVALSLAGERSAHPGDINVTDGDNTWYGRITTDGVWIKSRAVTPEIESIVEHFAADPARTASVYGLRFNHCCFCARELTDPVSVEVGYGPVCADHFGLPHKIEDRWAGANAPHQYFRHHPNRRVLNDQN